MLLSCKGDWMKSFKVASFVDWKTFHLYGHMCQDAAQEFLMILDKSFRWLKAVRKKYQMLLFIQSQNLIIKILINLLLLSH